MAQRKISKLQLVEMIENLDLDDEELLNYLEIDSDASSAFDIAFRTKTGRIKGQSRATKGLLGTLNKRSRRKRQKKYRQKLKKRFSGIRIVSEGDSWFQYPLFLKDIIDNLNKKRDYAIYSLGYGGDWLSNIFREMEYIRAIRAEKPEVFLISGGGNDMLFEGNAKQLILPYDPNRSPKDYLTQEYHQSIEALGLTFNSMFANLTREFPKLQIICHGYDYVLPKSDKWLGKPMKSLDITQKKLKREIARSLIDGFNEKLFEVTAQYERVHHVDLRGTLKSSRSWKDELHPKNAGFRKISKKIDRKIREVVP